MNKTRLKKIIREELLREAQWGNFTGGAAPLDEPASEGGSIPKEQLKKLWDIFTDMGKTPEEILATPEFKEAGIQDPSQLHEAVLKKIILEELQEACGIQPSPSPVEPSKDHSMSPQEGESRMAKGNLWHLTQDAAELYDLMGNNVDLPEWVEAKLTKAADYVSMVRKYLSYKDVEGAIPQDPEVAMMGTLDEYES